VIVGSRFGKTAAVVGAIFLVYMIAAVISRAAAGPPIASASDWLGVIGAGLFAIGASAMSMAGIVVIIGDVAVRSPVHGFPFVRISNEEFASWNVTIVHPVFETRVIGLVNSRRRLVFVGKVTLPYIDEITSNIIEILRDGRNFDVR